MVITLKGIVDVMAKVGHPGYGSLVRHNPMPTFFSRLNSRKIWLRRGKKKTTVN